MSFTASGSPQEVQGVGTTVTTGSRYMGDGDTWYHVVVAQPGGEDTDGEGFTFKQVGVGYYPAQNVVVDASAEAMDAWEAAQAAQRAKDQAEWQEREEARREAEARRPFRGRKVVVTGGRKVPVGTEGEVFWYGESKYGYRTTWRVGFATAEGEKFFTDAGNVEVVREDAAVAA